MPQKLENPIYVILEPVLQSIPSFKWLPVPQFIYESPIPVSREELFRYHARMGAFERLTPPDGSVQILERHGDIHDGDRLIFALRQGFLRLRWEALHQDFLEGQQFCDIQVKGPFSKWVHHHFFMDAARGESILRDQVNWSLPPWGLLNKAGRGPMTSMLRNMFQFRHRRTVDDLIRHQQQADRFTVLIVGRQSPLSLALSAFLSTGGHRVFQLERSEKRYIMRPWPGGGSEHPLDETNAVIHTGLPYEEESGDLSYFEFLHRALKTLRRKPDLWLNLKVKKTGMDRFIKDPSLSIGQKKTSADMAFSENLEEACHGLEPYFERSLQLYFGSLIRAPFGYLVQLLLRLEAYLFLEDHAKTPSFHWLALDDAVGAINFVLGRRKLKGDYAVTASQLGTRAELQELLIKHNFLAYTGSRFLKVQPWTAPGNPAGLEPELEQLPTLQQEGFVPLADDLPGAVARELGF